MKTIIGLLLVQAYIKLMIVVDERTLVMLYIGIGLCIVDDMSKAIQRMMK